ncbi:MAG: helix-turn-helix domain-containing protein [Pseudomonadota bacterium]|nr:helix-turn-helix domain-containing protein [Pseudomonadota bacterium]
MTTICEPRWLEMLRAEAARTTIAAVAVRLGYSRTTISLVMAGKYPGSTEKIAAASLAALEPVLAVSCPYLGIQIELATCQEHANQRVPTHNPSKMHHWRACHQCPNFKKGASK